jgi:putative hemolysin
MRADALAAEVAALDARERLIDSNGLQVYCARAARIPAVLEEIGHLRELAFRAAGEGTGKPCDLDGFDAHYQHLFLWDPAAGKIAGAYRMGLVDEILASRGKRGLYTHSLFSYPTRFLNALGPAIELGRSFVRAEYQRDFAPLFLLWRGIARFVERSPRYAVLFGAVSISASYSAASRRLMVEYLSVHCSEERFSSQVRPRSPYGEGLPSEEAVPQSLDELARLVAQIEEDRKGVPVLLRQYLRLGGRLLGFTVDSEFANTLDGLIMVDLRQIEPAVLARYMGKAASAAFLAHHGLDGLRPMTSRMGLQRSSISAVQ